MECCCELMQDACCPYMDDYVSMPGTAEFGSSVNAPSYITSTVRERVYDF